MRGFSLPLAIVQIQDMQFEVVLAVDRRASRLCVYRAVKRLALDTLLGHEEHFDYVSVTAPPTS